jgi:SAM-dependent methyltransferase
MSFKDHFSAHARGYSSYRPHYTAEMTDYFASLAPADAIVWDAGTGNGQLAVALAERFRKVIATDASADQIKNAAAHPNVEYRVEPSEATSLGSGSVGLITVAQAAHWFDLPRFYAEAKRVARPGSAIVLLGYELMTIDPQIDEIILWFYKPVVGEYWPPERKHLETGYRELPFPFEAIAARPLELTHEWTRNQLEGYLGTWSAVTRYRADRGADPVPLAMAKIAPLWPDPEERRPIRWPLILKAGRIT